MNLKNKIKCWILGPKATEESYITYLRKCGVKIGKGVKIFRPFHTNIDAQNPHLLTIGNNVFIGGGATILGGSHIGDNVIIGANSVVSGNVDSNSVYAGNPARKLMTLEEYRDKREKRQLKEAVEYVLEYKKRFKTYPPEEKMDEYFFLFKPSRIYTKYRSQLELMGNYHETLKKLSTYHTKFSSYKDFLNYCNKQEMVFSK